MPMEEGARPPRGMRTPTHMSDLPTPPAPHRTAHRPVQPLPCVPARAPREAAFSLVELIVVMLILGIIGAIAVVSSGSSHRNGALVQARSAARTLGEGVEQFQRDHGGRVPRAPGTTDWNPEGTSPVDIANGAKAYIKPGALEPITDGKVAFGLRPASTANASIDYRPGPVTAGSYAFVVKVRRNGSLQPECYVSNIDRPGSLAEGATRAC
ncbi:MAG: hypothetical protein JWM98_3009 [Thermoleophilia bacterium]|nr:hypothetical protein [Thermoleophilia bacterium]